MAGYCPELDRAEFSSQSRPLCLMLELLSFICESNCRPRFGRGSVTSYLAAEARTPPIWSGSRVPQLRQSQAVPSLPHLSISTLGRRYSFLPASDFINEHRKQQADECGSGFPSKDFAKLEHKSFLAKVPVVLGVEPEKNLPVNTKLGSDFKSNPPPYGG